ncbi:MAG: hypothetical protein V3V52_03930, partial [Candidatus Adiutricales bacterium]
MKLGEIFRRTAAGLLAGLLLLAAAEIEGGQGVMAMERQSVTKQKAAGLTFLPDWAVIILAAPWAGTRSEFGFPANELYAVD